MGAFEELQYVAAQPSMPSILSANPTTSYTPSPEPGVEPIPSALEIEPPQPNQVLDLLPDLTCAAPIAPDVSSTPEFTKQFNMSEFTYDHQGNA